MKKSLLALFALMAILVCMLAACADETADTSSPAASSAEVSLEVSYIPEEISRVESSTEKRVEEGLVRPTLAATPGDLSLVLPKRILDGIIEMIYALDRIAPGTANDDTLLYGVEVKFYNMEVELDEKLESKHKGLYIIGDGSGITHSLSHASASGVYVAREIANNENNS